ncbi:unnamed protein product, partial [Rotaria sp. Silwood2]
EDGRKSKNNRRPQKVDTQDMDPDERFRQQRRYHGNNHTK